MKLFQSFSNRDDAPEIRRVRHNLVRRRLEVRAVERLTPHMIRITLGGPELAGFTSPSPDDHIKIFVPGPDDAPTRRDYTPRRYDPQNGTLLLDFVNHHGGPAAAWARAAKLGDRLEIGGPRGSQIISGPIDHWLLIGDETALPGSDDGLRRFLPGRPLRAWLPCRGRKTSRSLPRPHTMLPIGSIAPWSKRMTLPAFLLS